MSAPVMLAPILRVPKDIRPPFTVDEVAATIRAAADNAAKVMPPLIAKKLRQELLAVADTAEFGGQTAWLVVDHWLDRIDEINAYAARSSERVEVEAFVDGTDPADADWTARFDTDAPAEALAANWRADAGVAHRSTIYLHGPWVIDRPAGRETAA